MNPAGNNNAANMSLSAILENNITHTQLGEWLSSPTRDIHARLVHFAEPSPSSSSSSYTSSTDGPTARPASSSHASSPNYPRSVRSTGGASSSMAPAYIHQQSHTSTHPPSLCTYSSAATPTETSISTGLANHLPSVPLLEEVNGILERRPHAYPHHAYYECTFFFLSCSYVCEDEDEWKMHCLSHFRGEEPPRSVSCPLCADFEYAGVDGLSAWEMRMEHLARMHLSVGQTLNTSRPDFGLFHHLWMKRLIDDQDLKELKGGNHNVSSVPTNFVRTGGGRREREGRTQRYQHVGRR